MYTDRNFTFNSPLCLSNTSRINVEHLRSGPVGTGRVPDRCAMSTPFGNLRMEKPHGASLQILIQTEKTINSKCRVLLHVYRLCVCMEDFQLKCAEYVY